MTLKEEQDEMKMEKREQEMSDRKKTKSSGIDFIVKVCGGRATSRIGVRQNRLPLTVDGNPIKKCREI